MQNIRMQGRIEKGCNMRRTLLIMLLICCSTVAYATSMSVMITAPKTATITSVVATLTDVSALLTVVYGECPQAYGKGTVDYTTSALSSTCQQGITHPNSANMESESAAEGLWTDESLTPIDPSPLTPIPEPSALFLVGIGLAGLAFALRFRQ
jgi:hypothetical protein